MASTVPHYGGDDPKDRDHAPPFTCPPQTLYGTSSVTLGSTTVSASHFGNHTLPPLSQVAVMNRWPDIRPNPLRLPNLLGEERTALSDIQFQLKIHDQPKCARYCALSEKDRRTIRPEPILELIIESTRLSDPEVEKYLCFENYVVKCSILDETGKQDVSRKAEEEYRHPNLLVGSDVATASVVVNLDGGESCFFIFDDLSCRMQGSYRLKFDLVMINLRNRGTLSGAEKHRPFLATVTSDVFTTYSAGAFPGVGKRSELAHLLKAKGFFLKKLV